MPLEIVEVGEGKGPERIAIGIVGPPKSGKTTFGAQVCAEENGLLVDVEYGTGFVPYKVKAVHPESWEELQQLHIFANTYDTLVIDTLDKCYDLLEANVCARLGVTDLGEKKYGVGYAAARNELVEWMESLKRHFRIVVFLCHIKPGFDIESRLIDLPAKTRRAFVALMDVVGLMIADTSEGRLRVNISFDPSAGEFGSRIPTLHGKVLPADWKTLKSYLFPEQVEQIPQPLPVTVPTKPKTQRPPKTPASQPVDLDLMFFGEGVDEER